MGFTLRDEAKPVPARRGSPEPMASLDEVTTTRLELTKQGLAASVRAVPALVAAVLISAWLVAHEGSPVHACAFAVVGLGVGVWRFRLGKYAASQSALSVTEERYLRRSFEANNFVSGANWACLLMFAFGARSHEVQVLMFGMAVGSPGVAALSAAVVGRAFEALVLPQMLGLVVALSGSHLTYGLAATLLVVVYGLALLATARSVRGEAMRAAAVRREADRLRQKVVDEEVRVLGQARTMHQAQHEWFVALASHELRTPLQTVLTVAETLEAQLGAAPASAGLLRRLKAATGDVLRHCDDLAAMLRSDHAGQLHVVSAWFQPAVTFVALARECAAMARSKGLELRCEFDPQWIASDPMRIRQLLTNLISNAIKYTEKGSVSVRVSVSGERRRGSGQEQRVITLVVEDTGPGIEASRRPTVFEPWTRGDVKARGLGLGLAVVRALTHSLGGQVRLDERIGGGTVVTITLPVQVREVAPTEIAGAEVRTEVRAGAGVRGSVENDGPGLRILVVDDDAEARLALVQVCANLRCAAVAAASGAEALERLAARAFDVVLIDLQMPFMDGYELATFARALPQVQDGVALVACTAYRVNPGLGYLFDGEVAKPVSASLLSSLLASLDERRLARRVDGT